MQMRGSNGEIVDEAEKDNDMEIDGGQCVVPVPLPHFVDLSLRDTNNNSPGGINTVLSTNEVSETAKKRRRVTLTPVCEDVGNSNPNVVANSSVSPTPAVNVLVPRSKGTPVSTSSSTVIVNEAASNSTANGLDRSNCIAADNAVPSVGIEKPTDDCTAQLHEPSMMMDIVHE